MQFHSKPAVWVGEVKLRVENLAEALAFYVDILGFRVLEETDNSAGLTADGSTRLISLVQPEDIIPKTGRRAGLYHFAVLLPHRSDLARIAIHFAKKGIQFGASDHLVSEALYLEDPDGNGIEIYIDRDPATWRWYGDIVKMDTIPLNFESLLQERGAGQPWRGMPEGAIIGHIHLHVSHLDEAEGFYTTGLGFEVVSRMGGSALFMSTNRYHHHIAVNVWNGIGAPPTPPNMVGLDLFTLILPDEQRLDEVKSHLRAMGAPLYESPGGIVTADPAGNRVKLVLE